MLLGLAIGDSLGNTTESQVPAERRQRHGEIRDYLPNNYAAGLRVGLPSDDTQLAFWTLEHLLDVDGLQPEGLAASFASGRRIFGIGSTMRAFLGEWSRTRDWKRAAQESAGNGASMRIAPVILPHLRQPGAAMWADAALAGAVTHNDYASNAVCVAFVAVLWDALAAMPPVQPGFWLDRFTEVARFVEGEDARYTPRTPRHAIRPVSCWRFTEQVVRRALEAGLATVEVCDDWYSGAFLLETVPSVLFILERHGNDPEEAIIRAVNDTRDNDTVAAIVGAAVGALHGFDALPERWRRGLLGRTAEADDGRVHELLDSARRRWVPTSERLEDLLSFVRAEGRVCPMPDAWNRLWQMLTGSRGTGGGSEPPVPLILAGWVASPGAKAQRLAEQIRYASEHGALDLVDDYLRNLPTASWYRRRPS
jgi:ADP-ribosylglycohydrolase